MGRAAVVGRGVIAAVAIAGGYVLASNPSLGIFVQDEQSEFRGVIALLVAAMAIGVALRGLGVVSHRRREGDVGDQLREDAVSIFLALAIGVAGFAAALVAVRLLQSMNLPSAIHMTGAVSASLYCAWDWWARPKRYRDVRDRFVHFLTVVGGVVGLLVVFVK